ncbi:signal peptidase II [Candidatus Uhrbacteria bacterium]|nr:signal peptidase II [Candidatus Uhrbacteria bacterium]
MKHITLGCVAIFLLDRILKSYFQNLPDGTVFSFLPGLNFRYSLNPALFFFPSWSWIPWVALTVLIIILLFTLYPYELRTNRERTNNSYVRQSSSVRTALLPIFLGGASNVFDRFAYGGVIDYVEISSIARINLADILILAGLLGLIFKTKKSKSIN